MVRRAARARRLAANFSTVASARRPSRRSAGRAAWNDLVALRPTPGLVSRSGMWDGYPSPLAQMGPMARNVRDVADPAGRPWWATIRKIR